MGVAVVGQPGIRCPSIGDDDCSRLYHVLHELHQALARRVSNALESDAPHPAASDFGGDHDERLGLSEVAFALAGLDAPEVDLVRFNFLRQRLPSGTHHGTPQLLQAAPRRPVAAQAQGSLEPQGGHATLLVGDPPERSEPHPQRQMAVLEDRPRGDRDVGPTGATHQDPSPAPLPTLTVATGPALKPIRPAYLNQVGAARLLSTKVVFELQQRSGIVFHNSARYHQAKVASSA